jgi:hypothetical protein
LSWRQTTFATLTLRKAASLFLGLTGEIMTPKEQAHKLELIARQEAEDLRGWYRAVFVHRFRSPFPGELDAIKTRADQLGLAAAFLIPSARPLSYPAENALAWAISRSNMRASYS